jgi:hypothetical protein
MDVTQGSVISATFSRAMQPRRINGQTFTVIRGATPLSGRVTLDDATDTATFSPDDAMEAAHRYTATVTHEARDLQDRPLAADYTWSFSVARVDVVEVRAAVQRVEAPDYSLDAETLSLMADVDDVVQSVSGSATLTPGAVVGQRYVMLAAADLDTYAKLDEAFGSGVQSPVTFDIPAAAFVLSRVDLTTPQQRTLIIANISEGVPSYQAFEITFHAAP